MVRCFSSNFPYIYFVLVYFVGLARKNFSSFLLALNPKEMTRKPWYGLRSENDYKRYLDELSKSKGLHNLGGSNAVVRE